MVLVLTPRRCQAHQRHRHKTWSPSGSFYSYSESSTKPWKPAHVSNLLRDDEGAHPSKNGAISVRTQCKGAAFCQLCPSRTFPLSGFEKIRRFIIGKKFSPRVGSPL